MVFAILNKAVAMMVERIIMLVALVVARVIKMVARILLGNMWWLLCQRKRLLYRLLGLSCKLLWWLLG